MSLQTLLSAQADIGLIMVFCSKSGVDQSFVVVELTPS